jgi:hypothetical protein
MAPGDFGVGDPTYRTGDVRVVVVTPAAFTGDVVDDG